MKYSKKLHIRSVFFYKLAQFIENDFKLQGYELSNLYIKFSNKNNLNCVAIGSNDQKL